MSVLTQAAPGGAGDLALETYNPGLLSRSGVLLTQAHTLTSSDHTWVVSQGAGRIKNSFQNYAIQNIPTVKGLMKAYKSHEEENHHDWKSEKTAKCGTKQFQVIKTINKQHF